MFSRDGRVLAYADGRTRLLARKDPLKIDLQKNVVALSVQTDIPDFDSIDTDIRTLRIAGHSRPRLCKVEIAGRTGGAGGSSVAFPALDGGFVYWVSDEEERATGRPMGTRFARAKPPNARCRPHNPKARFSNREVNMDSDPASDASMAVDHGTIYYTQGLTTGKGVYKADGPSPAFTL